MAARTKKAPWGHVARNCVYCGKVGPRVVVLGGYAHRRCIPKPPAPVKRTAPARSPKD